LSLHAICEKQRYNFGGICSTLGKTFADLKCTFISVSDLFQETPYPLTATLISSSSSQDLRQPAAMEAKRKDVFDYSEETIVKLTKRVYPKTLTFDDQVEVHQDGSSSPDNNDKETTGNDEHLSLLDQPVEVDNK